MSGVAQDQQDAKILSQATKIVRMDILEMKYDFKGSLVDEQYDKLPSRLLMLIKMILQGITSGPKIGTKNVSELKAARAITELVTFNTMKRRRKEVKTTETHHNFSIEPVIYVNICINYIIYLGMLEVKVHAKQYTFY